MARLIDITGNRYGRWVVLGRSRSVSGQSARFKCVCDCGQTRDVSSSKLRSGASTSCGCYAREVRAAKVTTHGLSKMPEYKVWAGMKRRCQTPGCSGYKKYGERGIKVCARWSDGEGEKSGFECFIADMGRRPTPLHSIDRIDPYGDYEPLNCRWATREVQSKNQKKVNRVTIDGVEFFGFEVAALNGIAQKTYNNRIRLLKWTPLKAATTPVRNRGPH